MGKVVQAFWELDIYQLARKLQRSVFELTTDLPREELYSLIDQIRRSSRSIGANIAEAWGKRRYPAHFALKLSDSASECNETWHWLDSALENGYMDRDTATQMKFDCQHIGAMLEKMIDKPDVWCRKKT